MKKINRNFFFILAIVVFGTVLFLFFRYKSDPDFNLQKLGMFVGIKTQDQAIEIVKQKYAELRDYPSDELSRTIVGEKSDDGWYLSFIQNGFGAPIVAARCFSVLAVDGSIIENGNYGPSFPAEENKYFSAKDCKSNSHDEQIVSGEGDIASNRASVYCRERGGLVEVATEEGGRRYGVCIMPSGAICDVWNFLINKECLPPEK